VEFANLGPQVSVPDGLFKERPKRHIRTPGLDRRRAILDSARRFSYLQPALALKGRDC
jgi:hypothetical protein